jgi:hypothetical protein
MSSAAASKSYPHAGEPGGLRDVDLDALAEAAWETFVGEMLEACVGGLVVKEDHP